MSNRNRSFPRIVRILTAFILTVFLFVSCSDDDGVGPIDGNPGIPEIENQVHTLINQHRVEEGLAPLTRSDIITAQARSHSSSMSDGTVPFSHDGFEDRINAIKAQISISGGAENVAMNSGYSDPARTAFDGWLKSEGHKNNIEGNYDLTGIGVSQSSSGSYYLTQIFVKTQ